MADKEHEAPEIETRVEDLPDADLAQQSADAVKGGAISRSGGTQNPTTDQQDGQRMGGIGSN